MGEKVKGRAKPQRKWELLRDLRQPKGVSVGSLGWTYAPGSLYLLGSITAKWKAISTQLEFSLSGIRKILTRKWRVQVGTIENTFPPKTFLGQRSPGNSASMLYRHSLCSHLIQSPNAWPEVWAASRLPQHLAYVSPVQCRRQTSLEQASELLLHAVIGKVEVALNHCLPPGTEMSKMVWGTSLLFVGYIIQFQLVK